MHIDFAPLYRSSIGFDRLANLIENASANSQGGYPPYNIELIDDNRYRITMAVAGFTKADLDIQSQANTLLVKGAKPAEEQGERRFLYQGIAERGFERRFQLADYVKVIDANLENGLLHIELEREIPEAMKPRSIEIGDSRLLESTTR